MTVSHGEVQKLDVCYNVAKLQHMFDLNTYCRIPVEIYKYGRPFVILLRLPSRTLFNNNCEVLHLCFTPAIVMLLLVGLLLTFERAQTHKSEVRKRMPGPPVLIFATMLRAC